LSVHVQRDFLQTPERIEEFLSLARQFYSVVHPAYGFIRTSETVRTYGGPLGSMRVGINLRRAIPDLYWATFLGPEYVNMFGLERVLSTPCHSVEIMSDGGALITLAPSPLDYSNEPTHFEALRERAKKHLGIEAFSEGDIFHIGKVPEFRFLEEKKFSNAKNAQTELGPDLLSTVSRTEWNKWLDGNRDLALDFAREVPSEFGKFDFSPSSLKQLDDYVQTLRTLHPKSPMGQIKKIAAYVSQVLINQTSAIWSYDETDSIPSLRVGGVQVSPLARVQKALLEGEGIESWHRLLVDEILPKTTASKAR
jgi:hypothetical protein